MNPFSPYIIAISMIAWCVIHSLLISNKIMLVIKARAGRQFRFYRMAYNIFSLITLIPIIYYSEITQGAYIFIWSGYAQIIRGVMLAISIFLFMAGAKHYDGLVFLGIRQIKYPSDHKSLKQSGDLDMSGILNVLRHPWYSGAILLLWTTNIDINRCIVNIILTAYLIIGSYLEEKKLVVEFGDTYRSYQQNVSMLFPYRWLKSQIRGIFTA